MSEGVKLVIRPDGNCLLVLPKQIRGDQVEQFRLLWDKWIAQKDAAHPLFLVGEVVTVKDFILEGDELKEV